MCEHCKLTPGENARVDQTVSAFKDSVASLVKKAVGYLDEGDDDGHAAASIAISLTATSTMPQVCALLGFALVRLAHGERAGRMSDAEFEAWQAARDVLDERTRDAATPPPPSTQEDL